MRERHLSSRWLLGIFALVGLLSVSFSAADPDEPALDWEEAAESFHAQRWTDAAPAYRAIVEAQPDSAFAWFRLP